MKHNSYFACLSIPQLAYKPDSIVLIAISNF